MRGGCRELALVSILLPILVLAAGCIRVPDVEGRLQNLRFHPNMYVVQAGDTIESIAHRYQLSKSELVALNRGAANRILPGDRLNIRPGTKLSADVRNRTGGGWYKQPANRNKPRPVARRSTAGDDYLVVEPVAKRPAPVEEIIEEVIVATAPTPAGGTAGFKEEIVADDYAEPLVRSKVAVENNVTQSSNNWFWPAEGEIAREYAPNEVNGQGVDIAGVPGQDIKAAADGTVVYTGRDLSNSGQLVILRHQDDLLSTYSHAKDLYVAEDDFVQAGDPIASLGWNVARESVLHFEVRKDGKPVDPMIYLPIR